MLDITELLNNIQYVSTDDLHRLLNAVKSELPVRENNLPELVDYIPDFCDDDVLLDALWAECDSLNMGSNRRKAATQWISPKPDPYVYPDSNPIHRAKDIDDFPAINRLMGFVNTSSQVEGPLNSCLIIKYSSGDTALSLHADDEDTFDHSKAICSFSMGCSRTLEFYSKSSKPKAVKSVRTDNNGLLIMRPGTQDRLKHCVRPDRGANGSSKSPNTVRYAISFRALAKSSKTSAVSTPTHVPTENTSTASNASSPKRKVCLVAGDSYAARLDIERLGKSRVDVVKIAKGGAKMEEVCQQLEKFFAANPDVCVDKLFVSVGTNDLRRCFNGPNHLKGPLKHLSTTIKKLSSDSKVFFQSLLPLPLNNPGDWETNANICDLNIILYENCIYNRFYYIDAYVPFCNVRRWGRPDSRKEKLFEKNGIHPSPEKGMGVLAKLYIRALHSKFFEPFVFQ